MLRKFKHLGTDVFIYEQENETIRLLQTSNKLKMSSIISNEGAVTCKINCSYFSDKYVLGRNQGDEFNDTHDQQGFYDLVFTKDGKYHIGNFKSWDYKENVLAGFSVASVLIMDGVDTELVSSAIVSKSKITTRDPQTAIAVLDSGDVLFIVCDGRGTSKGLTGTELRTFIKANYKVQLLCQLDGGGSTEMVVGGKVVNTPSDGKERSMFNCLAFIEKQNDIEILFPCADGWISQGYHSGHKAIDIGWLKSQSNDGKTPIYACADGVVEVADYYDETVNGKKVRPIVCIIRHDELDKNYTYYSAYWHLSSTPKNKGDKVKAGDEIGIRGNTGYSGGVHLHFVLMKCPKGTKTPTSYEFNKYAIDPLPYIYLENWQVFDGKGVYSFPVHNIPNEDEDILREEIALLQAQIKALESDKQKNEQTIEELNKTITGLNSKLLAINEYANFIVSLSRREND